MKNPTRISHDLFYWLKQHTFVWLALFLVQFTLAQTPESCLCVPDTLGLKNYLNTITLNENNDMAFHVPNATSKFAVLAGVIGSQTPTTVQNFINNYPNVTTLVFMQMPGSMDDDANLQASRLLRNRGYITYLPAVNAYSQDAFVASGGTDMLLLGNKRIIDAGAEVGVHAWAEGATSATAYPVGHAKHQPYIDYYVEMGFSQADSEAFYYFTINAAPANGMHKMTEAQIEQYKLRTCKYSATPTYTTTVNSGTIQATLPGANYQWVDCDNGFSPIAGATSQSFAPTVSGNYAVDVTEASCAGRSACQSVISLSIEDTLFEEGIRVVPNPVQQQLVVDLGTWDKSTSLRIYTIEGRLLKEEYVLGGGRVTVPLDLSTGMYILQITSDKRIKNINFLAQ